MKDSTRPTKKQKILLEYIEAFIAQHGYSPSYREIMNGVGYTSVATVAVHVNNLISRGHLVKRENAARSLEPTGSSEALSGVTAKVDQNDAAWLFKHIEARLVNLEKTYNDTAVNELYVLVGATKVLGFKEQAVAYITRLKRLEKQ